jgi:hypothetical protein
LFVALILAVGAGASASNDVCAYRYQLSADIPEPQFVSWSYPVGAKLRGRQGLNFEGNATLDDCTVTAEIQRDYSVNPKNGVRSKEKACWFVVELAVHSPGGAILYSDRWSIRFDDMGLLLETHGAKDPETYFHDFFSHAAYLTSGLTISSPKDIVIDKPTIESSLRLQQIKADAVNVASEVASLDTVRTLIYRGSWKEDVRVVAYVPSLKRGILIQLGY